MSSPLAKPMIFAVIVLYKRSLQQAPSFASLLAQDQQALSRLHLLVWVNGGDGGTGPGLDEDVKWRFASFEYLVSPANPGIARPYNTALARTPHLHCQWLLLLDQDSRFASGYISELLADIEGPRAAAASDLVRHPAAVVPTIIAGGRVRSPRLGIVGKTLEASRDRLYCGELLTSINSGALVSVDFLQGLGGFDERYWLDGLDTWLFMKIREAKRPVLIKAARLQHDLSLASVAYVGEERMANIMRSEWMLLKEFRSLPFRLKLLLGVTARCLRLLAAGRWRHLRALLVASRGKAA